MNPADSEENPYFYSKLYDDINWNDTWITSYVVLNVSLNESETDLGHVNITTRYTLQHIVLSSIIVTVILLAIVIGNGLVIVAIAVDQNLKGPQNWFIASLAVSDLLVGLFVMPLSLANELMGYWYFGTIICELWLSTDVLLCTASILNLCLISLDRYWSITRAIEYIKLRTQGRAIFMISTVWILSMVICLPPLVGWKRPQPFNDVGLPLCLLSEELGYVIYSSIGSFYLPLALMIMVYFKIYLAARKHARRNIKKKAIQRINNMNMEKRTGLTMANKGDAYVMLSAEEMNKVPQNYSDELRDSSGGGVEVALESETDVNLRTNGDHACHSKDFNQVNNKASNKSNTVMTNTSQATSSKFSTSYKLKYKFLFNVDSDSDSISSQVTKPTSETNIQQRCNDVIGKLENATWECGHTQKSNQASMLGNSRNSHTSKQNVPDISSQTIPISSIHVRNEIQPPRDSNQCHCEHNTLGQDDTNWTPTEKSNRVFFVNPTQNNSASSSSSLTNNALQPARSDNPKPLNKQGGPRMSCQLSVDNKEATFNRREQTDNATEPLIETSKQCSATLVDDPDLMRRKIARARERRATLVLGIVMVSFVGCWLPFFMIYPITQMLKVSIPDAVFAVIFWLGYCNSALNPIIYTIFNREFRQAFTALLFGRRWAERSRRRRRR